MRCTLAVGVASIVLIGLPFSAQAQNSAPPYFIFRVETDLQRQLVPRKADVIVIMDTTAAIADGKISPEGLSLNQIHKDLSAFKKTNARVHFDLFFFGTDARQQRAQDLLRCAVIGAAHEHGLSNVTAHGSYYNSDVAWSGLVDTFAKKGRQPKGDEPAKGNDAVKVFPVRSQLSRYRTGDADCVVLVVDSLDKEKGMIPAKVREATAKYVAELKLTETMKIAFVVQHVESDLKGPLVTEFGQFAKDLGFKSSSVTFR